MGTGFRIRSCAKENTNMRILFIGDVIGRSGRTIVNARLPGLIADWKLDLVVVNGENSAGGFGITEVIYNELIDAGRVLAIDHDQVELPFGDQARQARIDDGAPGAADHVADEKDAHVSIFLGA